MKRQMKGLLSLAAALLVGSFMQAAPAQALTFDLNCVLSSAGCTPTVSYGTITLTDSGNSVLVSVNTVGSGVNKVLEFGLNMNPSLNNSGWSITGTTITANEDAIQADGYTAGKFDLNVPSNGNLGFEPFSGTISKTSTNLDPSTFDFNDTNNVFRAFVHIGIWRAAIRQQESVPLGPLVSHRCGSEPGQYRACRSQPPSSFSARASLASVSGA